MSGNTDTNNEKLKAFNEKSAKDSTGDVTSKEAEGEKLDPNSTNKEKVEAKAKEHQKTEKEIKEEQARLTEEQRQKRLDALEQITKVTQSVTDTVNERVNPVRNWLAAQPTPGGIAAVLIFIAFFALAAIPVNEQGQTRLYLLWQTLLNRTHMRYVENGGSASGTFGSGGTPFGPTAKTPAQVAPNGNFTTGTIDLTHLNIFGV